MRIRDYLAASGISLSDFAARAGVSEAAMSRYATGKRLPRPPIMARITDASEGRIQPNDLYRSSPGTGVEPSTESGLPAGFVDLMVADLSGIPRGKRIPAGDLPGVLDKGINLCASVFALDATGENVEASGLVMSSGDADRLLIAADGEVRPVPWVREPRAQLLMTMTEPDGEPFYGDPRQALRGVLRRFEDLDLTPVMALEPEFYLMDQERNGAGMGLPATSPRTGRRRAAVQVYSLTDIEDHACFLNDIQAACRAQGVPAGSALSEYAAGQFEVNLKHSNDALAAADHAFLLKRIIKGVARAHGYEATFMAKPFGDRAGSGLHIHLSLTDKSGRNIFAGGGRMPVPRLRHAIGGLRAVMPEAMALFAPNANSYRRFRPGSYAPLAPTWGVDNRTVALRVPLGPPESRRVEHRVAGADANPYLALAAVLTGVHHGLVNEIDPGPPIEGNGYEQAEASLPVRWLEALAALDRAKTLPGYFDPRFLRLYSTVKRAEMERFDAQVTPLEHQWYLSEL